MKIGRMLNRPLTNLKRRANPLTNVKRSANASLNGCLFAMIMIAAAVFSIWLLFS